MASCSVNMFSKTSIIQYYPCVDGIKELIYKTEVVADMGKQTYGDQEKGGGGTN